MGDSDMNGTQLKIELSKFQQAALGKQVTYEFLGETYTLCTSHDEVVEYADRFMKHYRVATSNTPALITIYASDEADLAPYHLALQDSEIFQMHLGKGDRWNMRAKAMQQEEWRIVHLLNTNSVFLLNPVQKIGVVLGHLDSSLKEDVFHLIRSVMCRSAEYRGYSIYHAAGTVVDGKGVMIVGESGQGKTTTFLEFISSQGTPISNDRVFICDDSLELRMHEWPSFVNTSVGTLQKIPQMRHLMPDLHFDTLEDLWYSKVKIPLEPPQFCEMFGVAYQKSHTIDILIFPQLSPTIKKSYIKPISVEEARELLKESCYSPIDPAYFDWHRYVELDLPQLTDQSARITERLIANVPCFVLKGGLSLNEGIEQVREQLGK